MATAATFGSSGGDIRQIAARLERLPYSSWHRNMRLIVCSAWFFDAFDSITIAYVLPSLLAIWHLPGPQIPAMIGSLIAIGFAGQLVGAIAFGWIAERWGRLNSMIVTLLIFTLGGLACAFTTTYDQMWWLRFAQGIGLGGEVPLMAAYVNEFAKAEGRGRFSLSAQVMFSIGLPICALIGVYVVPNWGWQWMFVIGAVPALIAIPLRTMLPESPRWLASRGRFAEADAALKLIEDIGVKEGKALPPLPRDLPPVNEVKPRIGDLFKGIYLKRTITVWFIWIGAYFVTYGLTAWAPSLFNFVFHLSVQQSLAYGLILSGIGLGGALLTIYLIEAIGRKPMFVIGLGICSLPLLAFAFLGQLSALEVLLIVSGSFFFCSFLALGLATYTAEIYPTQLRALGGGVASAWQRAASMAGPIMVGWVLPHWGLNSVFVVFGLFALMGCVVTLFFAIETRGQVLERLSPPPAE
ncbi:MAG TPA: MFS transporter [Stellaceae bacterium]|jgi:putative MFS transporter|nr:MFS transporter [Stellaceae bacterium]